MDDGKGDGDRVHADAEQLREQQGIHVQERDDDQDSDQQRLE
jgi:hypothetical protein